MPLISQSDCPWLVFPAQSTTDVLEAIRSVFLKARYWTAENVPAYVIGTFSGVTNGHQVHLDAVTYTFRDTLSSVPYEVKVEAAIHDTLLNLKDAINRNGATAGSKYSSTTIKHPTVSSPSVTDNAITVNAIAGGGAGNRIPVSGVGSWGWGDRTPHQTGRLWYGGYKFRLKLPRELLPVVVYMFDQGNPVFNGGQMVVQLMSEVSPDTIYGPGHGIDVPSYSGFLQIIVNHGTFWISNPAVASHTGLGAGGTACCGGTQHVLMLSGPGGENVTEAWWSFSDNIGSPFFSGANPRVNLWTNFFPNITYGEGCWDGAYHGGLFSNDISAPRIVPFNSASAEMTSEIRWYSGQPMIYDPYLAWGPSMGQVPLLRGLIPDARIESAPAAHDAVRTDDDGTTWMNYTHNYIKGGIWLRFKPASTIPTPQLGGGGGDSRYIRPYRRLSGRIGR